MESSEGNIAAPRNERVGLGGHRFVVLWALGLGLLYAVGGYLGASTLRRYAAETHAFRQAVILARTLDAGAPLPEPEASPTGPEVKIGLHVNGIEDGAVGQGSWKGDFDVWFRWSDPSIDPGATFRLVAGEISQREKLDEYVDGPEHYARYHVTARLLSGSDPARYPFGDEVLAIQIEDQGAGRASVRYVADLVGSGVARFGVSSRHPITTSLASVKTYLEDTSRGDPRASPGTARARSRYVFAMLRAAPGWPIHAKTFQALFASVAISLLAFFIQPTWGDGRFGLGVGAVFAAIASNSASGGAIPAVERFTLTSIVNAVGLATICVTLVASVISLFVFDTLGRSGLRRLFDAVSFVVCLLGYTTVNLLLPYAAMP